MKKRKHNSKALTAAERRACLDGLILTADDEPALPDWWIVSPSTLEGVADIKLADANPEQVTAIFRELRAIESRDEGRKESVSSIATSSCEEGRIDAN